MLLLVFGYRNEGRMRSTPLSSKPKPSMSLKASSLVCVLLDFALEEAGGGCLNPKPTQLLGQRLSFSSEFRCARPVVSLLFPEASCSSP